MTARNATIIGVESGRRDLLAFKVIDRISETDIEWMAEKVDAAFDALGEIDLLVVMDRFQGAELGALVDGEAAHAMVRSVRHVRKYGVVGAPAWARAMIEAMGFFLPLEARTFPREDIAAAWRWMDGGPS